MARSDATTSSARLSILVLQGPNLNLLGTREPDLYGQITLQALSDALDEAATDLDVRLEHFQSNHEGALVDRIHQAWREEVDGVLINPGAYTHTSIALRDAFLATGLPFVEVHLSNTFARESFRHRSLLADCASGVVIGFGPTGYALGLTGLVRHLRTAVGSSRPTEV